ncbi:MAG: carbonic anhydrase [Azonexus sp.]
MSAHSFHWDLRSKRIDLAKILDRVHWDTWTAVLLLVASGAASAEASLCQHGRRQSPVDIVAPVPQKLASLEFLYRRTPLKIANDGHTARVRFANGSQLRMGKETYTLQQFHFHTPGGDRLAGEEFPMSAHLLHKSKSGQLLALVVLFRLGAENPALTALLPHIPAGADGDHLIADAVADASALLPAKHAYYRYVGSLTASPCTEGVTWLVMKQPLELSPEQLRLWRTHFADNIRPPQPLWGRVIQESM